MIKTKVTLTSGETVDAYYLDEETKKTLETIIAIRSRFVTDNQLQYQVERSNELEAEIRKDFYEPQIQKSFVDLLRDKDLTAQQIRKAIMPSSKISRLGWRSFWDVWYSWTKNNVLTPISNGKGKPRLWHLSGEKAPQNGVAEISIQ